MFHVEICTATESQKTDFDPNILWNFCEVPLGGPVNYEDNY